MKKLLTLAALIGAASLSYGQGYVELQTGTRVAVVMNSGGATTSTTVWNGTPGSWYYELLVAPDGTTTAPSPSNIGATGLWQPVSAYALGNNTSRAGSMIAGGGASDTIGVLVSGYGATATANFAIIGWQGNLGTDYAAVLSGISTLASNNGTGVANWAGSSVTPLTPAGDAAGAWFGISSIASHIALAPNGGPYQNLGTAALMPTLNLNYYQAVPEPGTLALAGLGAAAMMIFRRRK